MVAAVAAAPEVGLDFETSGLRPFNGDHPIGFTLGFIASDGHPYSWYVPVAHRTMEAQADASIARAAFADALRHRPAIIGHNLKFDLLMGRVHGYDIPDTAPVHDTLVQAHLIDENRSLRLESVVSDEAVSLWQATEMSDMVDRVCRGQAKVRRLTLKKRAKTGEPSYMEQYGHSEVPIAVESEYSCRDVAHALLLDRVQRPKAMGAGRPYEAQRRYLYANEMLLVRALMDMQFRGQLIDKPYLLALHQRLSEELDVRGRDVGAKFGAVIPWNNDNQLRDLLYKHLKLPVVKETNKGLPAVDRSALLQLRAHHPGMEALSEWRVRYKVRSTYTESLAYCVDRDGRVHGDVLQHGTKTGRFSMKGPNLQNVPTRHKEMARAVRRAFVIEDGWARLFIDYSQIELRMLAHYTASSILRAAYHSPAYEAYAQGAIDIDEYMLRRAKEPKRDVHSEQAKRTFGADPASPDWKTKRRAAKIINFGVPYGMQAQGLNANPDLLLPQATANEYFATYHRKNPEISATKARLFQAMVARRGTYFANWTGRCRHVPALRANSRTVRSRAERETFASLIQGAAGELTRYSIVKLYLARREGRLPAHATSTVHDEVQLDCKVEDIPVVARRGQRTMESFRGHFPGIPVVADVEVSTTTWADKADYEECAA